MIINLVKNKITEGRVFENPGGGVTEVVRVTELGIYYKRGNSKMLIKYGDIEKTYLEFKGKTVSTEDLRFFNSKVFDSKKGGHSCNCTVFFLILEECGLINDVILGNGKCGNPFYVRIKA